MLSFSRKELEIEFQIREQIAGHTPEPKGDHMTDSRTGNLSIPPESITVSNYHGKG